MNPKQREWLANKLADLGNLAAAIMLFGWIMPRPRPSMALPVLAWAIWATCHTLGFVFLRKE